MPRFSVTSKDKLDTCDVRLVRLFNAVIKRVDCVIIEGFRDRERQERMVATGRSKVHFPDGKHNQMPSHAVDVGPYDPVEHSVPWPDKDKPDYLKQVARFYLFAGYVRATADQLGIPIRWGGDWDGDYDIRDQEFDDLVHFELRG